MCVWQLHFADMSYFYSAVVVSLVCMNSACATWLTLEVQVTISFNVCVCVCLCVCVRVCVFQVEAD